MVESLKCSIVAEFEHYCNRSKCFYKPIVEKKFQFTNTDMSKYMAKFNQVTLEGFIINISFIFVELYSPVFEINSNFKKIVKSNIEEVLYSLHYAQG